MLCSGTFYWECPVYALSESLVTGCMRLWSAWKVASVTEGWHSIFFLNYLFIYLWLRSVFDALCRLSLSVESGGTPGCCARASFCGGFSCGEAHSLGVQASLAVHTDPAAVALGLSCSMWNLPRPEVEPMLPALCHLGSLKDGILNFISF